MKRLIIVLFAVLLVAGIYCGVKDANNSSLVGVAAASITAHNAEVEKVAEPSLKVALPMADVPS